MIVVALGTEDTGDVNLTGRQIMHSVQSLLRFRIVAPSPVGWFRVLSGEGEDAELLHLARDRATAETWRQATGRPGIVLEEISADEVAMAVVEGGIAA